MANGLSKIGWKDIYHNKVKIIFFRMNASTEVITNPINKKKIIAFRLQNNMKNTLSLTII